MLLTYESSYYAISIIQNKWTVDSMINGKTEDELIDWWRQVYYKKTGIGNYLIETIDEKEYHFTDENENNFVFLTKKYYDFVCELVNDFFNDSVSNNILHSNFMSFLQTLF